MTIIMAIVHCFSGKPCVLVMMWMLSEPWNPPKHSCRPSKPSHANRTPWIWIFLLLYFNSQIWIWPGGHLLLFVTTTWLFLNSFFVGATFFPLQDQWHQGVFGVWEHLSQWFVLTIWKLAWGYPSRMLYCTEKIVPDAFNCFLFKSVFIP